MRRRSSLDVLVERVRAICPALPETNERVSHGEPTWFAGKGKVFAMRDNHYHGAALKWTRCALLVDPGFA